MKTIKISLLFIFIIILSIIITACNNREKTSFINILEINDQANVEEHIKIENDNETNKKLNNEGLEKKDETINTEDEVTVSEPLTTEDFNVIDENNTIEELPIINTLALSTENNETEEFSNLDEPFIRIYVTEFTSVQDSEKLEPLKFIKPYTSIEKIDYTFNPPNYSPIETNIVPLTNTGGLYSSGVRGKGSFVRRDATLVDLPDEVNRYLTVNQSYYDEKTKAWHGSLVAFAVGSIHKMALLDLDGNLITEFKFSSFMGHNGDYLLAVKGYAILLISEGERGNENYKEYLAVIDLRTGKETLPLGFENIIYYDFESPDNSGTLVAEKDGMVVLIDYYGNILYNFGKKNTLQVSIQEYSPYLYNDYKHMLESGITQYFLDTGEMFLLKVVAPINSYNDLSLWRQETTLDYVHYYDVSQTGDFIIARYNPDYDSSFSWPVECDIYDLNGRLLAEKPFGIVSDIRFSDDCIVIYKDSKTCGFLYSDGRFEQIYDAPEVERFYID